MQSFSLSTTDYALDTMTLNGEYEGAFTILRLYQGYNATASMLYTEYAIYDAPPTVIWAGMGNRSAFDSYIDENKDLIYIASSPDKTSLQGAFNCFLVMRLYGEYLHHFALLENEVAYV